MGKLRVWICVWSGVVVLGLLFCFAAPHEASALVIDQVVVNPAGSITSSDDVVLDIYVSTSTIPAWLASPTSIDVTGNSFDIEMYIDQGDGDSIGTTVFPVSLGQLAAGDYTYFVNVSSPYHWEDPWFTNGGFSVVPEPNSVLMVALGLLALSVRRLCS